MKGYGQFCPVAKAAQIFCERWTALLLRDLGSGATHFSELQRGVPLMSRSMLTRRLQQLEREHIVERKPHESGRGATYHLTPAGREFLPLVHSLGVWGQRWSRRELADDEMDFSLLLWSMERGVKADAFGKGRTVVQLDFTDQPSNRRRWWLVNEAGKVDVCIKDPGFEIGLYLSVTLGDMIYIWRGDLPLDKALKDGRLKVTGAPRVQRALASWLTCAALASVESQRDDRVVV